MSQKYQTIILGSLATVAVLSGAILASSNIYADDVVDQINITVPVSCSLSGTGMNTHNAEINNGQYNSAIGETTIKAFCNDNNGFAIYAIGYTDDTDGKNVLTSSTLGSTYDIVTGTTTSGNASNWAMKLSTVSSPTPTYPITIQNSFDSFQAVPDDYTLVAKRTSGTDIGTSAEGSTLITTYQAYISPTQPAGTYTGQVKYTLVHPNDAAKPIIPVTIATAEYLQEVNSCPADLPEEQVYTLKDSRDEQEYKVAKLRDGKCWMVENLNIAGGTALSSDDTDFDSSYILPTTGNWTVSGGKLVLPVSATKNLDNNNLTDNTQFSIDDNAYVFNSGNKENCGETGQNSPCYSYYSWDAATLGSGRNITLDNIDAPFSICPRGWKLPTSGGSSNSEWKRGDYYALATAYGANLENNSSDSSIATGANFYNNAGPGTTANFLLSGNYGSGKWGSEAGTFYHGGTNGSYWSSTSYSAPVGAHEPGFRTDAYFLNSWQFRSAGDSIRCLLKTN